ncbi:tyrosine-protein kinase transmembrane receptor Ror2 [Trichonephila clavipes]|nr:tyrosine-protein kinase transmembrane receptor Ror2 [Trichonephila clavipes]
MVLKAKDNDGRKNSSPYRGPRSDFVRQVQWRNVDPEHRGGRDPDYRDPMSDVKILPSFWTAENPQLIHHRPLHSPCVTVWCVVAEFSMGGSYFFEGDKLNYGQPTVLFVEIVSDIDDFNKPKLDEYALDDPVYTHSELSLNATRTTSFTCKATNSLVSLNSSLVTDSKQFQLYVTPKDGKGLDAPHLVQLIGLKLLPYLRSKRPFEQ